MLSMSELAMNPNRKVTTVCYGKKQEWDEYRTSISQWEVDRYLIRY